jgi:hypothetical protein
MLTSSSNSLANENETNFIRTMFAKNKNDLDSLLNSVDHYLSEVEIGMQTWLSKFQWDKETLLAKHHNTNNSNQVCPLDKFHKNIKQCNLNNHINKCRLKSQNYTLDDIVINNFFNFFCFYICREKCFLHSQRAYIIFYFVDKTNFKLNNSNRKK